LIALTIGLCSPDCIETCLFSFSPLADQDFAKCLNLEKEEGIVFECSQKTISRVKGEPNKLQTEKDQSKVKECAFIDLGAFHISILLTSIRDVLTTSQQYEQYYQNSQNSQCL
jgi:hypothetical protein